MAKIIHRSGTRKKAVARGTLYEGKGIIRVNHTLVQHFQPLLARSRIEEPLIIAGDVVSSVDIDVNVNGGGFMSQAEAARLVIARLLSSHQKRLEKEFLKYDRHLLVADVRRKEPCKPNDSKARAKRQKSYR